MEKTKRRQVTEVEKSIITELRNSGLKLQEIASHIGVSVSTISRVVNNVSRSKKQTSVSIPCDAINVSVSSTSVSYTKPSFLDKVKSFLHIN